MIYLICKINGFEEVDKILKGIDLTKKRPLIARTYCQFEDKNFNYLFYTEKYLEYNSFDDKFKIELNSKRIKEFLSNDKTLLNEDEIFSLFNDNKKMFIKEFIKLDLYDGYEVLNLSDNGDILLRNNFNDKEEIRDFKIKDIIFELSEYEHFYSIFDNLGLMNFCLEETEDYDTRVLELAKASASLRYNLEDYEIRITDGCFEDKDLYYIVCWMTKEWYKKNQKYYERNLTFKCGSDGKTGSSYIIELFEDSKFTRFLEPFFLKPYENEEDLKSYLYCIFLAYLYTKNLKRLDSKYL